MDQRSGLYSMTSGLRVSAEMVWIFFPSTLPLSPSWVWKSWKEGGGTITKQRCDVDGC